MRITNAIQYYKTRSEYISFKRSNFYSTFTAAKKMYKDDMKNPNCIVILFKIYPLFCRRRRRGRTHHRFTSKYYPLLNVILYELRALKFCAVTFFFSILYCRTS